MKNTQSQCNTKLFTKKYIFVHFSNTTDNFSRQHQWLWHFSFPRKHHYLLSTVLLVVCFVVSVVVNVAAFLYLVVLSLQHMFCQIDEDFLFASVWYVCRQFFFFFFNLQCREVSLLAHSYEHAKTFKVWNKIFFLFVEQHNVKNDSITGHILNGLCVPLLVVLVPVDVYGLLDHSHYSWGM